MSEQLAICNVCGCGGSGMCGRLIADDGSVWPSRDTGYRVGMNIRQFQDGKADDTAPLRDGGDAAYLLGGE